MQYMPLFVDMKDKAVLFVGGGNVALRKARQFYEAGAQIKVIAPEIKEGFNELPNISTELTTRTRIFLWQALTSGNL